jgi:hypothetical protein
VPASGSEWRRFVPAASLLLALIAAATLWFVRRSRAANAGEPGVESADTPALS